MDVASIATGSGVIEAIETVGGVGKILARVSLNRTGSTTIRFTPTGTLVRLRFRSSAGVWRLTVRTVCQKVPVMEQESYLVKVCDDEGDKYRFGFNGQEKVNEWSGIGNFNDFGSRMQDTRTGRLNMSIDPLANSFPGQSPYVFAGNSPILNVDKDGEIKTVYTKIIDLSTGKTYIRTETMPGLLRRTSYHTNSGIFADKSDFYRQSDWHDYSVTNTLIIGKDGKQASFRTQMREGKIRTSTYPFMGQTYASWKAGEGSMKTKDRGMFDGFYLYSKDADGSDWKFNPKGGPGSKAIDAGVVLKALGRVNTIVGTPPADIIDAIKYANDAAQIVSNNAEEGLIDIGSNDRDKEKWDSCTGCGAVRPKSMMSEADGNGGHIKTIEVDAPKEK